LKRWIRGVRRGERLLVPLLDFNQSNLCVL